MREGMRRWLLAMLVGALGLLVAPAASAKNLPRLKLTSIYQTVHWHGRSLDLSGQGYGPPTEQSCTPQTCDSFILHIHLPAGSMPKAARHPAPPGITRTNAEGPTDMPGDGVLITIRWATDFDQWNLYVDDLKTGRTVAQAIDLDSNAQSVLLSRPHNGDYRVTMVPFYTDFNKKDLRYRGEAHVFLDPAQRHRRKTVLLPILQTVAPSNFHIGDVPDIPSNPTGWRYTPDGTFKTSCYLDEQLLPSSSKRCLRFDNNIRNVGQGPLVLRFQYSPSAFVGHCVMNQEVLWSNAKVSDRGAGPCIFHKQHLHFHYQNMAIYQLYAVNRDGFPGHAPVAISRKVGFCTIDVDDYTFGRAAREQRPRTYSFPTCNIPNGYSKPQYPLPTPPTTSPYGPHGLPEYMGISPGWGDVYTWDLPAQYIDITRVGAGIYEVVSKANPDGRIRTASRAREEGVTCISITGSDSAGWKVHTLRAFPSRRDAAPLPRCPVSDHDGLSAARAAAAALEF